MVVLPTLLLTRALIYSHKEPIKGAQSGKPRLQNNFLEQLGFLGGLLDF